MKLLLVSQVLYILNLKIEVFIKPQMVALIGLKHYTWMMSAELLICNMYLEIITPCLLLHGQKIERLGILMEAETTAQFIKV